MHTSEVVDALTELSHRTKRWSPTVLKRELELGRIVSIAAFLKDAPCFTAVTEDGGDGPERRVCRCRRRRGDWHCVVARFAKRSAWAPSGSG